MAQMKDNLKDYQVHFHTTIDGKVGECKRTHDGQEITSTDFGNGPNAEVLRRGRVIMKARKDTRYQKRNPQNMYYFYDCECGWKTGRKYNKKAVDLLLRLHKKKCKIWIKHNKNK